MYVHADNPTVHVNKEGLRETCSVGVGQNPFGAQPKFDVLENFISSIVISDAMSN